MLLFLDFFHSFHLSFLLSPRPSNTSHYACGVSHFAKDSETAGAGGGL